MNDLETLPEHLRRPDIRPIQPIRVQKDGEQFVALRDPSQLSSQTMVVPPQALQILQLFRGDANIEDIATKLEGEVDQFVELARGLDRVGLLWGPTFEQLERELKERIQAAGAFPAGAARSLGDDEAACREQLDTYFRETEDPELDGAPLGIVAPHLDYERGWPNYAAAYYTLRGTPAPDRVFVLGTNHMGLGDGVVLTEYGFDSPMGRCPVDEALVGSMVRRGGKPLVIDQLDHLGEHSIQLHLPWIQYCFGNVPTVAVLMPDPLDAPVADDGERIAGDPFVELAREALDEVGGTTLFIASSDLSHVGPQFGEPRSVDEQRRMDVEQHDREMLAKFITGDAEEFLSAMSWNKNPTRWCSIGNMTAILRLVRPSSVEFIDYRQAYDDEGMALVSSAALVLQ